MNGVVNALSYDVEDWFQSCVDFDAPISRRAWDNTIDMMELMAEYGVRSTFFVQGMVAEAFPELIRRASEMGHEIGTHGHSHKPVYELGEEGFRREIARSVGVLEDITGKKVFGFRAPDFSVKKDTPWAWDVLVEHGLKYDSSVFPISGRRYGIPDAPRFPYTLKAPNGGELIEFPLSTLDVWGKNLPIAGGGYIRHFPYRFTRWALGKLNRQSHSAVLYFHPYEIDIRETLVHRRGRGFKERLFMFRQGLFRSTMRGKFHSLFRDFKFAPICEVLGV